MHRMLEKRLSKRQHLQPLLCQGQDLAVCARLQALLLHDACDVACRAAASDLAAHEIRGQQELRQRLQRQVAHPCMAISSPLSFALRGATVSTYVGMRFSTAAPAHLQAAST
jgi:hypothetical protein